MIHKAHVTDDWARDSLVIQVRRTSRDAETIGYMAPPPIGPDQVPILEPVLVRPLDNETVEAITAERGHAPGLRVSHADAVAIHEALGEYLGHHDRPNATKLAEAEQRANDAELALAVTQAKLQGLERVLEATNQHLDDSRETVDTNQTTVNLERDREARTQAQLDGLATAYQRLQEQLANPVHVIHPDGPPPV